jgi:hypothetical protein
VIDVMVGVSFVIPTFDLRNSCISVKNVILALFKVAVSFVGVQVRLMPITVENVFYKKKM